MTPLPGLDDIRSFLILAEELNYRRTAARLNLDQSALSRRIQKLEAGLGFRLFERTTREVLLTQAGRDFYEENSEILNQYAQSVESARQIAEGKTGRLHIGYMAFAAPELMPRAMARFQEQHPHVQVKLRYIRTRGQKIALAHDEIDIGFLIGPFDHADYHSRLLSTETLYMVSHRDHPLLSVQELRPDMLAGEKIILGDMTEWEEYRQNLNNMFSAEGINLNIALEATNTVALVGLVAAGIGITILPESLVNLFGQSVAARRIAHPGFESQTVLVWKRTSRSQQVRDFVKLAAG